MTQESNNRRGFLRGAVGLAAASAASGAEVRRRPPDFPTTRQETAYQIRQSAALFQCNQPEAAHPTNGDETSLPAYIGNLCKGLPHAQNGEALPAAYQSLIEALSTGTVSALESIDRGSGAKFVDPLASLAFQMDGADSHRLG